MFSRRFLIANAVAVSAIALAVYFPSSGIVEIPLLAASTLVLFPILAIKFLLHMPISRFGIGLGNRHIGLSSGVTLLGIALASCITFLLISHTSVGKDIFGVPLSIRESFPLFLIHTSIIAASIAMNEFFFRGFVLFTWEMISKWASILAGIAFVAGYSLLSILHTSSTFSWSIFCATLSFAIGATLIASFTRSILFSFCFSFVSGILATAFAIFLA